MSPVRWGILGPGRIARAFATGLAECAEGEQVAIGSRSAATLAGFGDDFAVPAEGRHLGYAALCADPAVEAIYVATPHPFHLEHALMVLGAGKHLLLEKPAGLDGDEVRQIAETARTRGLFWTEGYMYLHHPQIAAALALLPGLGPVRHIRADFCFDAPFDAESRLYAPALAGGGVLDVGGYVLSAARFFAGAAAQDFPLPLALVASGRKASTGVDALAMAQLTFANGVTAQITCAVDCELGERIEVYCAHGRLSLLNPWLPGKDRAPADSVIAVTQDGQTRDHPVAAPQMLYAYEAAAASRAIRAGKPELSWPLLSSQASVEMADLLADWRRQVLGAG